MGTTHGYSNLTPSGFVGKTPKGSNVNNTVSYAVELQDNAKELPDHQRLTRTHRHLYCPQCAMALTAIR